MPEIERATGRRRRQGAGSQVYLIVLCVVAALITACAAFLLGSESVAAGAFFGLLGVGFLVLGYAIYRRLRPPPARHLELSVDRRRLRRGEPLEVTVRLLNGGKVGRRLELGLVCTEFYEYGQTTQRVTAQHIEYEEWREVSRGEPHQRHSFLVPESAPYSHDGDCLSFRWRVSARQPARFRFDRTLNEEIEVGP